MIFWVIEDDEFDFWIVLSILFYIYLFSMIFFFFDFLVEIGDL